MNRLQHEKSPYLKQHEDNPVDWFPWGEEALEKAKKEDKPILVSIGYSSCHWCHVMAHECFENEQLAQIMNAYFVNIKIDREERPDIDAIYMDALHAMGIRGGWPLNVFLMPDAKPFYGGTYFPAKNWQNILLGINNAFKTEREKLQESADKFAAGIGASEAEKNRLFELNPTDTKAWSEENLEELFGTLLSQFDPEKGGFNRAPKFPMPSVWLFILNALKQKNDPGGFYHLKLTLDRVALGGIFDHLAGGWTRYSTDDEWKVPHFEKMLYDNGQLLELYAEAYSSFRKKGISPESQKLYQWAVESTLNWLKSEMKSEEGGYFSALDADSEGIEGKYYVWTKEEIDTHLKEDSQLFSDLYSISSQGNWEHGNNVIHLDALPNKNQWNTLLEQWQILLKERNKRIRPGLDHKILCSWNGLLLSGLTSVADAFSNPDYKNLALDLAEYIEKSFLVSSKEGVPCLNHLKFENQPSETIAFLEDYAAVIKAYIQLYQLAFEEKWLHLAAELMDYCLHNFFDPEEGMFFFTDSQAESLIARKKEIYDNVIPSSNSMIAESLIDLSVLLGKPDYKELAKQMFGKIKKITLTDPGFMTNWAKVGLKLSEITTEIAIVGPNYMKFREEISQTVDKDVYFAGTKGSSELALLKEREPKNGETLIYVCQNHACNLPVQTPKEALELLNGL
ncbi:thioredoxin domain-containing protein [Jiulongibacter sp. NS-SX5]|uniref:thioredoxin domain-containing protein n=1 Tax=Jiulongibacter sp. NS-SX5 TaxID=3463854 RepID=UPI00405A1B3F